MGRRRNDGGHPYSEGCTCQPCNKTYFRRMRSDSSSDNSWRDFHEDDQVKVKKKNREDGGTEYLHFYKDPSLTDEAARSRTGQNHDHVTFHPDGSTKHDSTKK